EAGYFAALVDAPARVVAASAGFDELGIAAGTLERLVDEAGRASDRLVKRLATANAGSIPVGIARLTDDPQLYLLIAVDEPVEEPAPQQAGADAALPDDDAAPSDADLPER